MTFSFALSWSGWTSPDFLLCGLRITAAARKQFDVIGSLLLAWWSASAAA